MTFMTDNRKLMKLDINCILICSPRKQYNQVSGIIDIYAKGMGQYIGEAMRARAYTRERNSGVVANTELRTSENFTI